MRILVISDSHGRNDDVKGVLEQVGEIDMLIHCGDVERGDQYIRDIAGCPVVMVAGNNDYYLDLPSEETIEVEMHDVDVVMYGHTHVPFIEIGDDMTILNPGSISYPRQAGRKPTFLLMEIDDMGEAHYAHGYYKEHFRELNI